MKSLLQVDNVNYFVKKNGEKFQVLKDISFDISLGDRIGILGKNGSGKSVLLKVVADIIPPSSGTISRYASKIALQSIGSGLRNDLSGYDNIKFFSLLYGFNFNSSAISQIKEISELTDDLDIPVKFYSSGMKARLKFAISLLSTNDILIFDEALSTGDKFFKEKCKSLIKDKIQDCSALVIVSHDFSDIREFCNRCIVMNDGEILFDGLTEDGLAFYSGLKK